MTRRIVPRLMTAGEDVADCGKLDPAWRCTRCTHNRCNSSDKLVGRASREGWRQVLFVEVKRT